MVEILLPVAEEIGFAVIPVTKDEIVVEDEIRVMKEVNHHRRIVHRKEARRRSPTVYVLAPDVKRRRNNRARLPFNSLFRSAGVPDCGLALAAQDVDHLFKKIALRIGARS